MSAPAPYNVSAPWPTRSATPANATCTGPSIWPAPPPSRCQPSGWVEFSITESVTSPPPPTTLNFGCAVDGGAADRSRVTLLLPCPVSTVTLLPGGTTCEDSTVAGLFASTAWTRSILTVWSPVVTTSFNNRTTTSWVGCAGCSADRSITTGSALISMRGSSWSKINFGAGPDGVTRCETEDLSPAMNCAC